MAIFKKHFLKICSIFLLSILSAALLIGENIAFIFEGKFAFAATTYYVDVNNGADSNEGSSSSPWQTITRALSLASAGDTINVIAGQYSALETFPLTITANLTIQGAGASATTITTVDNDDVGFVLSGNVTNVTISGFTIVASGSSGAAIQMQDFSATGSSGITVSNNIIQCNGVGNLGIEYGPASGTIRNNVMYNCPNNVGINLTQGGNPTPPAMNVTVENNTIYGTNVGIEVAGFSLDNKNPVFTLKNNIVVGNNTGINIGAASGAGSSITATLSYNNVYNNSGNYGGAAAAGIGDISCEPFFTNVAGNDFTLQTHSPTINTGDPSQIDGDSTRINMGAYAGSGTLGTATVVSSTRGQLYVNNSTGTNALTNGQGASAGSPFDTLTYAVAQACAGDTINVAAGTYNQANGESIPFPMKSNITLQGANIFTTILEGTRVGDNNPSTFEISNLSNITIAGFTITGDGGNYDAIFLGNNVSNVTVSGNILADNQNTGIQLYGDADSVIIEKNIIYGNTSGIWTGTNAADDIADNPVIRNNLIYNNDNSGIFLRDTNNATIENNTIYGHTSGNGIQVYTNGYVASSATMKNNIITQNNNGMNISDAGATITSSYNNVYGNTTNLTSISQGIGDISADPLFVSTTSGSENFRLQANSPSIDTGTTIDSVTTDIVGLTRPYGAAYDQGAYENDNRAPVISAETPASGATDVAQDENISFRLADGDSGIDTNSIALTVGGESVTPTVTAVSAPKIYDITYDPPTNFTVGASVTVAVSADDLWSTPNSLSISWSFTVINPDADAPVISNQSPSNGASSQSDRAPISFTLTDSVSGVDSSTLIVTVNNSIVTPTLVSNTGTTTYNYSYTPDLPYTAGSTVTVTVAVDDLASSPNSLSTSWSFSVQGSSSQPNYGGGKNVAKPNVSPVGDAVIPLNTPDDTSDDTADDSSDETSDETTAEPVDTGNIDNDLQTPNVDVMSTPGESSDEGGSSDESSEGSSPSDSLTFQDRVKLLSSLYDTVIDDEVFENDETDCNDVDNDQVVSTQSLQRRLGKLKVEEDYHFVYAPLNEILYEVCEDAGVSCNISSDAADYTLSTSISSGTTMKDILHSIVRAADLSWGISVNDEGESVVVIGEKKDFKKGYYLALDLSQVVRVDCPWVVILVTDNPVCGNGVREMGEKCDQGDNNGPDKQCTSECTKTYCGDYVQQFPNGKGEFGRQEAMSQTWGYEECDDGPEGSDDCNADCTVNVEENIYPYCGNGIIEAGEECDGTVGISEHQSCDVKDCSLINLSYCGDGITDSPNGEGIGGPAGDGVEACDDAGESSSCTVDCTVKVNDAGGTGDNNTDGDNGGNDDNDDNDDNDNNRSTLSSCGNGSVESPNDDGQMEACDDGNTINGDGCSSLCSVENTIASTIVSIAGTNITPSDSSSTSDDANDDTATGDDTAITDDISGSDDTPSSVNTSNTKAGGTRNTDICLDYDGSEDTDSDGWSDQFECYAGTSVDNPDTDGDGMNDSEESEYGTNPLLSSDVPLIISDISQGNYTIPQVTNIKNGQILVDNSPLYLGVGTPGMDVVISLTNDSGLSFQACTTSVAQNGKFLCSMEQQLRDDEYTLMAKQVVQEDKFVILQSKPLRFFIRTDLEAPILSINRFSGEKIDPRRLLSTVLRKPNVEGTADYNSIVQIHWQSAIFSSALISDATSGSFFAEAPQDLEPGKHTVYAYALRPADNVRGPDIKIDFTVEEKPTNPLQRPQYFWPILVFFFAGTSYLVYSWFLRKPHNIEGK